MTAITRTCTQCGEPKPLDLFYRQKNGRHGRSSACKECRSRYNAELAERWAQQAIDAHIASKVCPACGLDLPLDAYHKNRKSRLGVQTLCRPCHSEAQKATYQRHPEVRRASSRRWAAENRDRVRIISRNHHLRTKYGISQDKYEAMATAQDGRCVICDEEAFLVVDHCHSFGLLRGLICQPCNGGLGAFRDNPQALRSAADYLETFRAAASDQAVSS